MTGIKKLDWYGIIRITAASALAFLIAAVIIVTVAGENADVAIKNFFLGNRRGGPQVFPISSVRLFAHRLSDIDGRKSGKSRQNVHEPFEPL